MKTFGTGMAIACLALAVGCGKSDPAASKEGSAGALAAAADKPDVYVQALLDSIEAGDSKAVWNGLPAKYQADVKAIKNEFAGKVDPEVWSKGFVVADKLAQTLKTKKEYLLGSPLLAGAPPPVVESLKNNWDTITAMVDSVAQSEIKTVDGLKAIDPGKFLEVTGNKLLVGGMKIAETTSPEAAGEINKVRKAKVSLVKVEGDKATLKVETEGEPPKDDVVFKKIDGKWLPGEMVDGWDKQVAAMKGELAEMKITPEQKAQYLQGIGMAEATIDGLLGAKDQASFNGQLSAVMMMASMFGGLGGPPPDALGSPGTPGGVPVGGPEMKLGGPGSFPPPGSLPKPSGTIVSPTLPSTGPTLTIPEPKLPAPK
ncbi:MAG: hypothetical protein K8U03_13460 [Planctomycetia bacterium]|nr:hypothetical protein [Planctomycetia bacterium]